MKKLRTPVAAFKAEVMVSRSYVLVEEGVMPDFFHVVPVGHDTMFDWVFEREDTAFGLGFVAGSFRSAMGRREKEGRMMRTQHTNPSDPYRPSHPGDGGDRQSS